MRVFGFAGWSGSGKTTLIEQIIPRLIARGLTVALIKHAHHYFEVDHPGKDSWRHREAGCTEVLISSDLRWALIHELRGRPEPTLAEALAKLSPCDLALVEGYKTAPIPKLEIWRAAVGKPPLHPRDPSVLAIATDSPEALPAGSAGRFQLFGLDDYDGIATLVIEKATARPSLVDDTRAPEVP